MLGTGSNRQAIVARHVTVGGQAPVTAFHRGDFRATLGMILESEILNFLHEGRIAASGTPKQLLHTDHPATAEFIRASRITLE